MVYLGGWMEVPSGLPNCPPGLEYLTMLDQLLVKQKVNLAQVLVGFEQNNKFVVKNSLGQDVIHARFLHSPSLLKYNFHLNFALPLTTLNIPFWRFIWPSKTLTAVHGIVAVQFAHSIWKYWMFIKMKLFIFIGHWLVQAAASHVVCNHWKCHHHLEM